MTQKISPFLWFDDKAQEAAELYVSAFKNAELLSVNHYGEVGPGNDGTVMTVTFRLGNREFTGLNGGPHYQFTPATSFFVSCENEQEINELWSKLGDGGSVLMGLDAYPFSERFGWLSDRFGVSWQMSLTGVPQKVTPFLMFVGDVCGRAGEAINFYTSLFDNSAVSNVEQKPVNAGQSDGSAKPSTFKLEHLEYMAFDSDAPHAFTFSPAISFFVNCESQDELDRYWDALLDGGKPHQCGWLDDRFGVTWQIVPSVLLGMLEDPDRDRVNRVTQALYQMIKIDIAELQRAFDRS